MSALAPVVLLHSGGMSSRQWRRLADRFSPTRRVIAPDFVGSGENPPWPSEQPFEFGTDVDLVAKLVADVGGPVHLVGHSYGGLVALKLARRAPERVASIATFDPVAFGVIYAAGDEEGLADLDTAGRNPTFSSHELGGTDAWFEVFVDYWNGPGAWRSMAQPARDGFLRVGRKVFYEVASLMRDRTPASAYAGVEAPALLLAGERSPAAARRVSALLAEALLDATLQVVAGAGHMGPITHPNQVNDAIAAHVEKADRDSREGEEAEISTRER